MSEPLNLPRVIAVVGITDHGPCEGGDPSAYCPHCGSGGRYVLSLLCEDGTVRGAMRGCAQLFPRHRLTHVTEMAYEKLAESRTKKRNLAAWYADILDAIADLREGLIDKSEWERRVDSAVRQRDAWLRRKGYK